MSRERRKRRLEEKKGNSINKKVRTRKEKGYCLLVFVAMFLAVLTIAFLDAILYGFYLLFNFKRYILNEPLFLKLFKSKLII